MDEKKLEVLALHQIIQESFTDEQIRIMLVALLEKQYTMNHYKITQTLDKFYEMFNKK